MVNWNYNGWSIELAKEYENDNFKYYGKEFWSNVLDVKWSRSNNTISYKGITVVIQRQKQDQDQGKYLVEIFGDKYDAYTFKNLKAFLVEAVEQEIDNNRYEYLEEATEAVEKLTSNQAVATPVATAENKSIMVNVELFKAKLVYFLNNRLTPCRIYKGWHDDVVIFNKGIKDEFGNKYTVDDFVPCIEPFYQYEDDEYPTIRFFLKADIEAYDLRFDDKGNRIKIEADTFMEVVR